MIDRVALAKSYGWSVQEIYRAKDAWRRMYTRQPASDITFTEYLDAIRDANIRPNQVGLRRGQYHFARFNDSGAYIKGNCRFIPQYDNQKERREGYQSRPDFRRAMSEIALKRPRHVCGCCGKQVTAGMLARWHNDKCKFQGAKT
jgi:hypothetical protein